MTRNLNGLRIFVFLCVIYSIHQSAFATSGEKVADSLLMAGNRFYIEKQYDLAAENYKKVISLGYEAADLYYNLGNTYYKSNKLAEAILYYEKALLLEPGHEDALQNLSMANSRIIDKVDAIPEVFLVRWFRFLVNIFSPNQWATISLVCFLLALLFFAMYRLVTELQVRRTAFYLGVALLLLTLVSFGLGQQRKNTVLRSKSAIVMLPSVEVKSSPDNQGTIVFVLHEGTKLMVTDSIQNWKEIRIADGSEGWVPGNVLGEI
jgi:tetratricopeptide (TPR) repeat protein